MLGKHFANAPHDSICGCSVDEVHREMETRFAKVNQVGNFVKSNLLNEWKGKIATAKAQSDYLFTVINTGLHDKVDTVSTVIDVATCDFKELHPTEGYKKMAALTLPSYRVEDLDGRPVEAKIEDFGANFEYDLPKRQVPPSSYRPSSARDHSSSPSTAFLDNFPIAGRKTRTP